ncbi:hypothetical protein D9C73_022703 [Collichthys lucidus]|uniref:Uncharacterized protein n=1 Tax=Collichthys lucidus TaxID=240159 RepID=A0A4U5VKQ2_COLLU|nr:hypothetical protein D9C73_022703 [Collichthys lucidus]
MAEELLEAVDRLRARLLETPEPRKLLKTFKRLGELPMTVDILVEMLNDQLSLNMFLTDPITQLKLATL